MTNEERDLITRFIERVGGAVAGFSGGSVPGTQGVAPVDPDADALIGQLMQKYPEARYRVTQLAFVQEHALQAAQQRIVALQQQVQQGQAQQPGQPSPWGAGAQPPQQSGGGGFFSSLFGGGRSAPPQQTYAPQAYAPQPQYASAPAGMFQPQGSGFLGGALRTAAGVAGGVVAADALMSLFEGGHREGFGSGMAMPGGFEGGMGSPGGWVDTAPISNPGVADPGVGGFAPDPYDQGGALKSDPGSDPYAQGTGWSQPDPNASAGGDSGWQDAGPSDGGGWDTGSNSDDGGWTDSSSDS